MVLHRVIRGKLLFVFFQTQRNFAAIFVDVENRKGLLLIELKELFRISAFTLTEFGDVNEGFNSGAELDECAKRSDASDGAFNSFALLELLHFLGPWVFLQLFDTKAQAIFVDSNDLGVNLVANFDVIARIVNTLPTDF